MIIAILLIAAGLVVAHVVLVRRAVANEREACARIAEGRDDGLMREVRETIAKEEPTPGPEIPEWVARRTGRDLGPASYKHEGPVSALRLAVSVRESVAEDIRARGTKTSHEDLVQENA